SRANGSGRTPPPRASRTAPPGAPKARAGWTSSPARPESRGAPSPSRRGQGAVGRVAGVGAGAVVTLRRPAEGGEVQGDGRLEVLDQEGRCAPALGELHGDAAALAFHVGASAAVVLPLRVDAEVVAVARDGVLDGDLQVAAAGVVVGVLVGDVVLLARQVGGIGVPGDVELHRELRRADVAVVDDDQLAGGA